MHNHAGLPVELLAAVAVGVALARRRLAPLALAGAALAEAALFVAMTQAGFSGNPRYVLPALATGAVLAGVGAANLAQAVPSRAPSAARLAGVAATVALLALAAHGFFDSRVTRLRGEAHAVGCAWSSTATSRAPSGWPGPRRGEGAGEGHDEPRVPEPARLGARSRSS